MRNSKGGSEMGLKYIPVNEEELIPEQDYGQVLNESGMIELAPHENLFMWLENVKFVVNEKQVRYIIFCDITNPANNALAIMIPAARQEGGCINVSNQFKGTNKYNLFRTKKGLKEEFNRLKSACIFHNPTCVVSCEGEANVG
jgi:hypothetical protein